MDKPYLASSPDDVSECKSIVEVILGPHPSKFSAQRASSVQAASRCLDKVKKISLGTILTLPWEL